MTFHKYGKIRQLGHEENQDIFKDKKDEIVIEEKIDGGNFRFMFKEGKIIFGSRTQELDEENIVKNWSYCTKYILEHINYDNTQEGLIYYGECCIKHTMSYDWEKIPAFLGFDIKKTHEETQPYMKYPQVKQEFEKIGLPFVPVIKTCKAKDITQITDEDVPVSAYAPREDPQQQAEGIVLKNYAKQIFAKYVRDKFKEKNAETFGGNPKYNKEDDWDNDIIVFKFCTNARIDKHIFKLIDEGHKLEMKLMEHLPKAVHQDIWEEEWQFIMNSRFKIDVQKLRKMVTKRCLAVLQQVITNNAFGGKDEETK